ncbi:MAG TPA: cobalt-precorrin-6A reductase [Methyloceanibacter sp.]
MKQTKLLILGGSGEAAALARALDGDARYDVTLSLAGRTSEPVKLPGTIRTGGFGGAEGLSRTLHDEKFDAVIDATHPFADQIKANAIEAARLTGVPLLAIRRPSWTPVDGDNWILVEDLEGAAVALGETAKRVFLTTGRDELRPFAKASQHFYLLRSVEAPARDELPAHVELITARGPFRLVDELTLLKQHAIDIVVTKNSGGEATYAKLAAARALGLPVVMVRRPMLPEAPSVETVVEALQWLEQHHVSANST